jgi:hypothetical protein
VSSERWLVSTLIAIHLVAISASSLPYPRELDLVRAAPGQPVDVIARTVAPALNAAVAVVTPLEAHAFALTASIRAITRIYIQAGLRQKWNMFANPVVTDQYVRMAHYVESSRDQGRIRVFRELVLPGQREDRPRLVHMFRDKAILNSLETLAVNRTEHPEARNYSDLDPVAAYFRNRFTEAYLAPGETVQRTEVWFGVAPTPPVGDRLPDSQLQARWSLLQRYWDGPVEVPARRTPTQPGALESEADIVWRLEYVQNR